MQRQLAGIVAIVLLIYLHEGVEAADSVPTAEQQRIRVLVEALASKNIAPGSDPLPKNYDKNAQVVVYLAIQQLLAEGSAGFDILIAHFNDKRYSYTDKCPDDNYDRTVGDVCHMIVCRCAECYDCEIHLITRDQFNLYLDYDTRRNLSDWWKNNRTRPLWSIQVEAIDRAVKFMETVDRDKARPTHMEAHRLPVARFDALRKDNLRMMKELRASIEARKEAYRPKSIDGYFGTMTGLPWPTSLRGGS